MSRRSLPRIVMHLDMDAFYAAVEVREAPELAGKPLIIGHRGRRGVVSTCSYEARRYGVHSAMPSATAMQLCPDAIWRPGRMDLYVEVSTRIRAILDTASPIVEPLSIDEAFLDFTGIAHDFEEARRAAAVLKQRIVTAERLTSSIGIAPNKFLAKVASDLEKPDGMVVLTHDDIATRLWPLPVRRLWGVGPKTAARLGELGLATIGDIARCERPTLARHVGERLATHLERLSHGLDDRPVAADRRSKSISEERTYGDNLHDPARIDRALLERAEGVTRRLRDHGLCASTVTIKVRAGDFTTWTRSCTLPEPTDLAETILSSARELLKRNIPFGDRGVRLLGVGVSGLQSQPATQADLFTDRQHKRTRRQAAVTDAVRERFGKHAITRARLLRDNPDAPLDEDEASSLPSVD